MVQHWLIHGRTLPIGERTLVMGVLNVTPDSFSDGAQFFSLDKAVAHARRMIDEGADIIDIGGESTRPGATPVAPEDEICRVVPVIEQLAQHADTPISIDTTKSAVAAAALKAGALIVNDISALRFDFHLADEVAKAGAGLVLMHSRGTPATLHRLPPVADILKEVTSSLRASITMAQRRGVSRESIVIDPGIGFGKSQEQNLELIARLDQLSLAFPTFPILIGTSRKSFIGRLLKEVGASSNAGVGTTSADAPDRMAPVTARLYGTMASITAAILRGAHIVRVHDVSEALETIRVADAIKAGLELPLR